MWTNKPFNKIMILLLQSSTEGMFVQISEFNEAKLSTHSNMSIKIHIIPSTTLARNYLQIVCKLIKGVG